MASRPDVQRRHRERREQTRRKLLDAARELLEDRPWREITPEDLTTRAAITRTAFYRHFGDQQLLLLALIDDVGLRLDLVADPWEQATDDPIASLSASLRELVDVFHAHGRLIQALADAATQDQEVAAVYADLGARLSRSAADRIAHEVAEGRSSVNDPEEVAAALVWMNERYLLSRFGRQPLADPERAAAALAQVWHRTVYR